MSHLLFVSCFPETLILKVKILLQIVTTHTQISQNVKYWNSLIFWHVYYQVIKYIVTDIVPFRIYILTVFTLASQLSQNETAKSYPNWFHWSNRLNKSVLTSQRS